MSNADMEYLAIKKILDEKILAKDVDALRIIRDYVTEGVLGLENPKSDKYISPFVRANTELLISDLRSFVIANSNNGHYFSAGICRLMHQLKRIKNVEFKDLKVYNALGVFKEELLVPSEKYAKGVTEKDIDNLENILNRYGLSIDMNLSNADLKYLIGQDFIQDKKDFSKKLLKK